MWWGLQLLCWGVSQQLLSFHPPVSALGLLFPGCRGSEGLFGRWEEDTVTYTYRWICSWSCWCQQPHFNDVGRSPPNPPRGNPISVSSSVSAHLGLTGRTSLPEVITGCNYSRFIRGAIRSIVKSNRSFFILIIFKGCNKGRQSVVAAAQAKPGCCRSSAPGCWRGAAEGAGPPSPRAAALAAVIAPLPCKPWWKIIKFHKSLTRFEPLRVSIKCNNGNYSF